MTEFEPSGSSADRHLSHCSSEPNSIRDRSRALDTAMPPGYRVEREPHPPYGWNLFDNRGLIVRSGSLKPTLHNTSTSERAS